MDARLPARRRLIASPPVPPHALRWITPTHTLTHLDGIAMGSLLALGLHTLPLSRRTWLCSASSESSPASLAAATIAGGTAFLDSALAIAFAGAVLASIASTGARNPLNAALCAAARWPSTAASATAST